MQNPAPMPTISFRINRFPAIRTLRSVAVVMAAFAFLVPAIRADGDGCEHSRASVLLLSGAPGVNGGADCVATASNLNPANASVYVQFEEPPRKVDIFQLQQLQLKAVENAQRSQQRIMVPLDAMAPQSTLKPTVAATNDDMLPETVSTRFHPNPTANRVCLGILLAGIGYVAARKYLPSFH